ncbi:NUDIX domain-containing protein [Curtobacterium flaccumfaciens]|nr:NUDIX domain-containing protein [Curtobacterium flaccumfaciens]
MRGGRTPARDDGADDRGRTGLDAVGRNLDRNPDVVVRDVEVVSNGWHVLRRTTLDVRRRDGRWDRQQRETYDRGNGAAVLPYDAERGTVLLTRQFRWPAYVNGHPDGMLVEAAAGLLDEDDPETAVRREAAEELGIRLGDVRLVHDAFMSPGSVTERVHCYVGAYRPADRVDGGGGSRTRVRTSRSWNSRSSRRSRWWTTVASPTARRSCCCSGWHCTRSQNVRAEASRPTARAIVVRTSPSRVGRSR